MTPEHDRAIADRLHETPLAVARRYTRDEIEALLRDWARNNPPRRFALYRTVEDEAGFDGDVFAWGLAHEHYLVVRSLDELLHGRFVSVDSLLAYVSQSLADVGLVWIDE